jgi:hypothetical protein
VRICYDEYVDAEVQQRQPVERTPACAPAVVYCTSSGTYTADGCAVNIRHEATLPGAALRLPCNAADGHTNNVSEGFPLLSCLRALTHN